MILLFLLSFLEDKRYCLVSNIRLKTECKAYSDTIVLDRIVAYTFNPSLNGNVEIYVHSSIKPYDTIELTSKQLTKKSFHFSGNPFLFVYKEGDLVMKSLSFDAPTTRILMYCTPKSTFFIDTFTCFGELEFRDKNKKNLIEISNFTVKNVFRTSMTSFQYYDQIITEPTCTLEIMLEDNDKIEFDETGMYVSDIFVDIKKYPQIILKAINSVRMIKNIPDPIHIVRMPSIIFQSPDGIISFNPVWGVSAITTDSIGYISANENIVLNLENIDDITTSLYKFKAKQVQKNLMHFNGDFCLYNSNFPSNMDCSYVRYTPNEPIAYPLPKSLHTANFIIYDTFPNAAIIDGSVFGGKALKIRGADLITKVIFDLSHGGPESLLVEHVDLELRGPNLFLNNFTLCDGVTLCFSDKNLPKFNVTNFVCDANCNFLEECDFHCHNLIVSSSKISLMDEFDDDMVDSIVVNFIEGHQITELCFRVKTFQIQFSTMVFRVTNEVLTKICFVLPFQQNKEIRVKNFFPENYKMTIFPRILYLNDSSVNYNFDESWEENNIHVDGKKGMFFHPYKNNYINSKSNISKLLEIFDLGDYVHSNRVFSSGYCIADDSSECGEDQQVVPNSDKILSRIFIPDPFGDCTIKIISNNVILDMHCFGGINVNLYATSRRSITLLFRPNVIIPKLEIHQLTTTFRTIEEMESIIIGSLISDTSDIQTTDMNTPLDIRNLMKILAFAYINIVPFLTPSTTRRINLVSSDDYPPISNLVVCPDHFVFEMTSKYSVIANFSMFSSITYIHSSQKSTKIAITPHNRFGSFLPKMPDFEFLSTSTYISFSEDWFELHPIVMHKGHVSTRHLYPAKIFTPRSVIPDIFIFDEPPIINFFSDSSICLYRKDESLCPPSYTPFKYSSRKINMKLLETYTRQLTFYVVESNTYDMPTIDEDIASLDKLTLTAKDTQYVAIHAEKVLKTMNLINTHVYIFSETGLPVYNLSMIGDSEIISDTMNISHATVSVNCFHNAYPKFSKTTKIVIMDESLSTILFGDDIISINDIIINYTEFNYISVTLLHTVIFAPYNDSYYCIKPLLFDFTGSDPSVTFDKGWKTIPESNKTNAILRSDVPIKIFGNPHNGFSFEQEYINSAAKMCIIEKSGLCPGGYTQILFSGDPIFLDDTIMQMELFVLPNNVIIQGESTSKKRLKLFSDSVKTVTLTDCFIPPESIELQNISLITNQNFSIKSLKMTDYSTTTGNYDIDKIDISWETRDVLESFKNNIVTNCSIQMPIDFSKMEVLTDSYIIWVGNNSYDFPSYRMQNIVFHTISQYINMSTKETSINTIPSIVMNQGIIFFDGKWENAKSKSIGSLTGMTEVIIDEIFPEHIFLMDPTISMSILAQDICLFNNLLSSEQCPRGAKQIKYSESSIELFALPDVWVYVTDTSFESPLRIRSRCPYISFELYSLGTSQDVIFAIPNVCNLAFIGVNVMFARNATFRSLRCDTTEIAPSSQISVDDLVITGVTSILELKSITTKTLTIVSSRMSSMTLSDDHIMFTDEFDNITSVPPPFIFIVRGPFSMYAGPNISAGSDLMKPTQIHLEAGAKLFLDKELSRFRTSNKVTIIKKGENVSVITNGDKMSELFELEDPSSVSVLTNSHLTLPKQSEL